MHTNKEDTDEEKKMKKNKNKKKERREEEKEKEEKGWGGVSDNGVHNFRCGYLFAVSLAYTGASCITPDSMYKGHATATNDDIKRRNSRFYIYLWGSEVTSTHTPIWEQS